ncbi:MAG: deacetylase [Kiritimatiellia bacterium]|jgi:hypothetical protein|nr:deacetylase [Kiritimatiellia bacterium]MDP6811164.1 deacetylase [Kiritimatiellia bacterium]MDP7025279.1 deacetylase [Kiritimatiellia bacterium]
MSPTFLVTVDTEGDNLWSAPSEITTENAAFLPRFQSLCEKYGVKPTYFVNYEMVSSPVFKAFGTHALMHDKAEIGTHVHAWNTPPLRPLTRNDRAAMPYLIDYTEEVMREKIAYLTGVLEETFQQKMVSHRAGRWGFDARYATILAACGYKADSSVTPHICWKRATEAGTVTLLDYARYPESPYFLDLNDIRLPGKSSLLELPMTVRLRRPGAGRLWSRLPARSLLRRGVNRLSPPMWLRPDGKNLKDMLYLIENTLANRQPYAQFMLHSSELMPGGSPTFQTPASIESLYEHIETVFEAASRPMSCQTVKAFAAAFEKANPQPVNVGASDGQGEHL